MKVLTTTGLTKLIELSKDTFLDKTDTINVTDVLADVAISGSYNDLSNKPTINDLTTTAQQNAINSGITSALVTQIGTNQTNISTINGKIPSAATSSNQLADKAFVNSTVQTNTANFRGSWATWSAVPTSASDYPVDYTGSSTPTVNDYMVVQDASGYDYGGTYYAWHGLIGGYEDTIYTTSATPQVGDTLYSIIVHGDPDTDPDWYYEVIDIDPEVAVVLSVSGSSITIGEQGSAGYTVNRSSEYDVIVPSDYEGTWRFKYSGTWSTSGKSGWIPEYQVNETPFTQAQLDAINSGITSTKVGNYDTHIADTDIHVTTTDKSNWNAKQAAITGAASTVTSSNLTASRVLISNGSGKIAADANVTTTELSYLDGVTSSIQTQLNNKQATLVGSGTGQNIKTINNTSLLGSGDISITGLPSQSGQSGKYLTTNGTSASWTALTWTYDSTTETLTIV